MTSFPPSLVPMRIGILLSLLTLVYGFGLGVSFGVAEDALKARLADGGRRYLESLPEAARVEAREKVAATVDKSWTYFQRAHLHANGLGTSSLVMILLLGFVGAGEGIRRLTAAALGAGSFGYAIFWMLAGLRAPALGSTGAAKESLKWLAVPSTALVVVGLLAVIVLFVRGAFTRGR